MAAVDVSGVVSDIASAGLAVGLIGAAVLTLFVGIFAYRALRFTITGDPRDDPAGYHDDFDPDDPDNYDRD